MTTSTSNLYDTTGIQLPVSPRVVIVRTEWNAQIMDKLEAGATQVLSQYQVQHKTVVVPGAVEIPFCIRSFWEANKYRDDKPMAFIALGCVLRGDTPHFDFVCRSVTDGITQLNLLLPVPTIFGILTVDNLLQVEERTGGRHGHKGKEAAIAAVKMMALKHSFNRPA